MLAIACGIVQGRGLGESAKAALTARGFAELLRFARAYGGQPETLMGLSGLGDLVLTCASAAIAQFRLRRAARARRAGGGGERRQAGRRRVHGGRAVDLARAAAVDMPIAEAVAAVVAGRLGVDDAVAALMNRPLKAER